MLGALAARLRAPAPACKNAIYGALILSILAVLGLGHGANGSQRAINFPLFSFQASELGKVLLILALSAFVVDRSRRLRERDTTVRVMIAALVPAMFVIAQPDLGSGHGLHGDRLHAAVRRRHLLAAPRGAGRARRGVGRVRARGRARGRRARAQALPGGTPDGVPAPSSKRNRRAEGTAPPLPAAGVQDRDRRRAEDRPRRERQPDSQRLRAREPHRLRLRGRRRAATASSARGSCCCSTRC